MAILRERKIAQHKDGRKKNPAMEKKTKHVGWACDWHRKNDVRETSERRNLVYFLQANREKPNVAWWILTPSSPNASIHMILITLLPGEPSISCITSIKLNGLHYTRTENVQAAEQLRAKNKTKKFRIPINRVGNKAIYSTFIFFIYCLLPSAYSILRRNARPGGRMQYCELVRSQQALIKAVSPSSQQKVDIILPHHKNNDKRPGSDG